jgi:hypothetical protein
VWALDVCVCCPLYPWIVPAWENLPQSSSLPRPWKWQVADIIRSFPLQPQRPKGKQAPPNRIRTDRPKVRILINSPFLPWHPRLQQTPGHSQGPPLDSLVGNQGYRVLEGGRSHSSSGISGRHRRWPYVTSLLGFPGHQNLLDFHPKSDQLGE